MSVLDTEGVNSLAPRILLDATNTVSIGSAQEVADATDRILSSCFAVGGFDRTLIQTSFTFVGRLFAGDHQGHLACDMPYHDLRHSLDTALVMARLIAGYQSEQPGVSQFTHAGIRPTWRAARTAPRRRLHP